MTTSQNTLPDIFASTQWPEIRLTVFELRCRVHRGQRLSADEEEFLHRAYRQHSTAYEGLTELVRRHSKHAPLDWVVKAEAERDRRFNSVQWQDGRLYSLREEHQRPEEAAIYRCKIDGDGIKLVEDSYLESQPLEPEEHDALTLISQATVIEPL